ncbi:SgcJ/EcaC family oxidoreductase [Streptomyces sp. NPDC101165]|uniref:SgcJ/EcaC family oxidoreductase n=1 Tax=Streptomyces sp. NPDC101165 TaxID=3366119 RepID=UPI0037FF3CF2
MAHPSHAPRRCAHPRNRPADGRSHTSPTENRHDVTLTCAAGTEHRSPAPAPADRLSPPATPVPGSRSAVHPRHRHHRRERRHRPARKPGEQPPHSNQQPHRTRHQTGRLRPPPAQSPHPKPADAWNRGDGTAFANACAEEPEFITFGGTQLRGRPKMARNFQLYFDNCTKGTRLVLAKVPVTLRHPIPPTAVVITTGCIANPGEPECRPDSHSIQTYLAAHGNTAGNSSPSRTPESRASSHRPRP